MIDLRWVIVLVAFTISAVLIYLTGKEK